MATSPDHSMERLVMTVRGPVAYDQLGITDAHNHLWIEPISGAGPGSPILDRFGPILQELNEYRQQGGGALLDCQPGGCGRDGKRLLALSNASGVHLIACTGFHRKKYYSPDYGLWQASAERTYEFLRSELERGLVETQNTASPVKAGFIKIALEGTWQDCPQAPLEGAVFAALQSKSLVEIHTEKGALAEEVCLYFTAAGLSPAQIVLCHMDKRPDVGLHQELARSGVLLEYDTFYRPQYDPAANLWPLLENMAQSGLANRVALATDMAPAEMYRFIGGGAGLASLPGEIQDRLIEKGFPETDRLQMLGGNIARRLAGLV